MTHFYHLNTVRLFYRHSEHRSCDRMSRVLKAFYGDRRTSCISLYPFSFQAVTVYNPALLAVHSLTP